MSVSKEKGAGRKRKATQHSDETRAKLGKYASVHGVAAAQRQIKKELGDLPAEGNITAKDRSLLAENGGYITLTRGWAAKKDGNKC